MTEFTGPTCSPCRPSRIRVCDQCGACETPSVSRFKLGLCGECMTTQYCVVSRLPKNALPSHKAICQPKSQVAAVNQPTAGSGYENVTKSLRKFTSAHTRLLGWAGFQALQLKRNPANVHQNALLVELTPTGHSDSHRRFSIAATHVVPRTYIRDPFVIEDIQRLEQRQVMPVEVDPPSKISWDTRDDWARVLQHFVDKGRTDFQPISTTSRG
ncbi:hypothetical protein DFH09DRAFT_1249383 [Mycena vulgaris]|nr:hypothetical protein DFH09DRAFT_1249383 [Mycena vulgaris]